MKKEEKNETPLKHHKQEGKNLTPPFLSSGLNFSTSSWFDERLPEMLWAVLVIGNVERQEALRFFRYIAKFVESNNDCLDVTLTGISKLADEKRKIFIKHFLNYSEEINNVLSPLLLFPELPSISDWSEILTKPNSNEDWQKLGQAVEVTFWHQSQQATDCRWVKILCQIVGGQISFIEGMDETILGILEYPNYGDMREIRPFIRSMEISGPSFQERGSEWAIFFWEYCYENTACAPEEAMNNRIKKKKEDFSYEVKQTRQHFLTETTKIRKELISHFFRSSKVSTIDSRLDGCFGLALYGISIFIETVFYSTALSITGRLSLRALVECYIVFLYLLQKEGKEPKVWDDYRSYGTGQSKLIYLKLQELNQGLSSIDLDEIDRIANEDKWIEFIPINLGHWDSANLRKMAEEIGMKDVYDKFYNYTSGFMHSNWGAVRESVYQKCINPLHRYHRIPIFDLPLMPSITVDSLEIINKILDCLSQAYPEFKNRFTLFEKE